MWKYFFWPGQFSKRGFRSGTNYRQAEKAINEEFNKLSGSRRQKPISEIAIEKCGFYLPLPDETLPFLHPSRYCELDRFTEMTTSLVTGRASGYDQCNAIVDYIRNSIQYTPDVGQQIISASELNQLGSVVCRDMAHLGIACCRALSIPARMVVGYLEALEPMDLHAWFEAYVGNRWYTFDPT